MTNAELRELVFNKIKSLGFKICDVTHPDGYFIFEMGDDSVTHFRLKGHGIWRKWKFGLWIHQENMTEEAITEMKQKRDSGELKYGEEPKVIQIFAQYETNIDKFKPSRSALCVEYDAEQVQDLIDEKYETGWYKLEGMLQMMYRHPFMCYEDYCGAYVGYYTHSFFLQFLKYEFINKFRATKKRVLISWWYPYTVVKCAIAKRSKIVHSIEIENFEKENPGWSTDYLYRVCITFIQEATSKEECAWLDRWFKKEHYGKLAFYDYVVEVGWFRKIGRDRSYTYDWGDDNE